MHQIVIASNNQGKLAEFSSIFKQHKIEVTPQKTFNIPEVDEPYPTFIENALHKARHCSRLSNLPALADDSGLCVGALNGSPGIYSARYAGATKSDAANNDKLLQIMEKIDNRAAYFYCCLVFMRSAIDPQPIIAEGLFYGEITRQAKGSNGHGYDPVFWLPKYNQTVAELDMATKNKISHRGIALQELITKLKTFNLIQE